MHGWKIKARLFRDGESYARRKLDLQVRVYGAWGSLDIVKRTDSRGLVIWTATPNRNRYQVRVHFDGNPTTKPSSSRVFYLPRR